MGHEWRVGGRACAEACHLVHSPRCSEVLSQRDAHLFWQLPLSHEVIKLVHLVLVRDRVLPHAQEEERREEGV